MDEDDRDSEEQQFQTSCMDLLQQLLMLRPALSNFLTSDAFLRWLLSFANDPVQHSSTADANQPCSSQQSHFAQSILSGLSPFASASAPSGMDQQVAQGPPPATASQAPPLSGLHRMPDSSAPAPPPPAVPHCTDMASLESHCAAFF